MQTVIGKMTIKDWIQAGGLIMAGAAFYYGTSYRIQALEESNRRLEIAIDKINATVDRINSKIELDIQNLKNDVNATTMRLELLKQEVEYLKKR